MVELSNNLTSASASDGLIHASSKFKNSLDQLDSFDYNPKAIDYSFADSFLDYDSLNDWIDELTSPVMADAQTFLPESETLLCPPLETSATVVAESLPILQASGLSTNLNSIIEEEMSKVSLVTGSREDDDGSDVDSEGTSSDSTSTSSSSDDEKNDEEESSSSSSSSDSSCDDEEDVKERCEIGELEEGEIRDIGNEEEEEETSADYMVAWDVDGEEAEIEAGPISSKNELKVLPPVPQVHETLQPHHQMLPVGVVLSIIGNQVIVEGIEKHNPLNEGSILWLTEARSPLGLVDEIFGPVKNPYYSVRYNSESEIPTGISSGAHVSCVLEFADHVLYNKDLYKKGYDASGVNDEEASDVDEFSDDEKELEFKKMQKLAKRSMNDNQQTNVNRNNARKKKNNNAKARKFGQRTFETAQIPDESRKYGQSSPQQATIPQGNKFDQPTPQQVKIDMVQPSSYQNQQTGPPLAPFMYHGGRPNPSAANQCFMNGTGVMPSFPPIYNPCFTPSMNGMRPAEMPFQFQQQQQPNPFFPNGLPMNGMPWQLQNPTQQVPQMPIMNTFPGTAYPQGFVGTSNPLTNIGAQGIHSSGPQFGQNQNLLPTTQQLNSASVHPPVTFPGNAPTQQFNSASSHAPVTFPGNVATQQFNSGNVATQQFNSGNVATQQFNSGNVATQQFNSASSHPPAGNVTPQQFSQGSSSNQGRKSYGRGGPHFRGRRGGRQSR